jgi:ABC-type phosphate transport system auxiliary subunit
MPNLGREMMRFEFLTQISKERLDNLKDIVGNLNKLNNKEKRMINKELARLQHQLSEINDRLSYILTSNGKQTASGVHSCLLAEREQGICRIVVHQHR